MWGIANPPVNRSNLFILWICNPLYPNRLTPNPSSRNAAASRILMIKFFISQSYFIISE